MSCGRREFPPPCRFPTLTYSTSYCRYPYIVWVSSWALNSLRERTLKGLFLFLCWDQDKICWAQCQAWRRHSVCARGGEKRQGRNGKGLFLLQVGNWWVNDPFTSIHTLWFQECRDPLAFQISLPYTHMRSLPPLDPLSQAFSARSALQCHPWFQLLAFLSFLTSKEPKGLFPKETAFVLSIPFKAFPCQNLTYL